MDAHAGTLIADMAVVTGVAAVTAMAARRFGQPSILGYLLAGLIVGPYIPVPLFADPGRMAALAEAGVVLVMFAVGLEFRIKRLLEILPISGLTAVVQIAALGWAGHTVGSALGWSSAASTALGATLAISSTMVVSAVLRAQPVDADIRAHVFGVLVVQDVVAILLMAIVTTLASGEALGFQSIGRLVGELSAVVLGMLALGLLVLPRLVRMALVRFDAEVLVVLVVGAAFGLASVAELFGYSVALGAFIAGMAVAESGRGQDVEHAIEPLRSLFAAIFFVSIGMTVDPRMAWQSMPLALGLSTVVVVAQFVSVTSASVLTGISLRRSVFAGLALGQIGELSFILATIGIGGGVLPAETLPALVTVATITAFTTPFLLGRAQSVVDALDRLIPKRLQLVLAAYQTFVRRGRRDSSERPLRRAALAVSLDWLALLLIFVVHQALGRLVPDHLAVLSIGASVVAVPFLVGLIRSGARLVSHARELAQGDPSSSGPRAKAVEAVALLAVALAIGVPTAAVMQPLVAGLWAQAAVGGVLVAALLLVVLRFRRVRPGYTSEVAQLVFELADQFNPAALPAGEAPPVDPLSGLDYETLRVEAGSDADGLTLAELNLRCETGAAVVAISRGDSSIVMPTGQERLRAGDVVAVSGSDDALGRVRALLLHAQEG